MAGCDDEINGEGSARPWEWIGADALRRLLASGEDPDGKDWFGKTWAARSAMEGDLEALEMLALAGADLDAADDEGFSPMCLAIEKRQTKAVQALLAIGASPDGAPSGRSPLTLAAMKGLPEIVEALLAAGADPNRSMDGGAPPILLATMALDARSVRALAGAGADVGARIDAGEGLLGYDGIGLVVRALGAGNPAIDAGTETIKALIEAGGGSEQPLGRRRMVVAERLLRSAGAGPGDLGLGRGRSRP